MRTLVHNPALHPGPDRLEPAPPGASTATRSSTRAGSPSGSATARSSRSGCRRCSRCSSGCVREGITIYDHELPAEPPGRAAAGARPCLTPPRAGARAAATSRSSDCPSMRLADGAFCHEVEAPGLEPRGRSLRYTLICLLGLQRAQAAGPCDVPVDPGELLASWSTRWGRPRSRSATSACCSGPTRAPAGAWRDKVAFRLHGRVGAEFPDLDGLELSWVVIGAAEAGADLLLDDALERQLARDRSRAAACSATATRGRRARFPNFATQIYGVLALARAARHGREHALDAGAASRRPAAGAAAPRRRLALDLRHAHRAGGRALRGLFGPPGRDGADGAAAS